MLNITGYLMSGNLPIAQIRRGRLTELDDARIPLYLKRTKDFEGWLTSRAIDSSRANAKRLKSALGLDMVSDAEVSLAVNAAAITDRYWFKSDESDNNYDVIRFKDNRYADLALTGKSDSLPNTPEPTPELTNTGSFEKCWRLINNEWWLYKAGNIHEYFSELFICRLCECLGLDCAHYEIDRGYIRSLDFTNSASVNLEPMSSLVDDNDDYVDCFDRLFDLSPELAKQYLVLILTDSICRNTDRHTQNFGMLRDFETGELLSLAPNYDNNVALIARGFPRSDRTDDSLIYFLGELLNSRGESRELCRQLEMPEITADIIDRCYDECMVEFDADAASDIDRAYIRDFILNGQKIVNRLIQTE